MELIQKCMATLFEQLGEPSDAPAMARFIALHGGMSSSTPLHEASFWTPSQASFLREAVAADAMWSQVVDELNVKLHATPSAQHP